MSVTEPCVSQADMSPEEQRIAIAEACGAKWLAVPPATDLQSAMGFDLYRPGRLLTFMGEVPQILPIAKTGYDAIVGDIPDYLNDLNAMHEAEKVLNANQVDAYIDFLINGRKATAFMAVFATATQRAEAFLRTIGKWA
jgi:hypothetical protein